jgi:hypothetical protein
VFLNEQTGRTADTDPNVEYILARKAYILDNLCHLFLAAG